MCLPILDCVQLHIKENLQWVNQKRILLFSFSKYSWLGSLGWYGSSMIPSSTQVTYTPLCSAVFIIWIHLYVYHFLAVIWPLCLKPFFCITRKRNNKAQKLSWLASVYHVFVFIFFKNFYFEIFPEIQKK